MTRTGAREPSPHYIRAKKAGPKARCRKILRFPLEVQGDVREDVASQVIVGSDIGVAVHERTWEIVAGEDRRILVQDVVDTNQQRHRLVDRIASPLVQLVELGQASPALVRNCTVEQLVRAFLIVDDRTDVTDLSG